VKRPILIAGVVLVAVAGLLWLLIPSEPEEKDEHASTSAKKTGSRDLDDDESIAGLEAPAQGPGRASGGVAAVDKLDPDSKEFFHHVDDVLPSHLYQEAVRNCYRPGLDRNARISINYTLRAKNGQLEVTDLKVLDSKIDPSLAQCIVTAVKSARWKDERMPDWEDEDDLYIQVGGMKKFLADDVEDPDEHFKEPSEEPQVENDGEAPITATTTAARPEGQTGEP
jgi:hypothetical protein